MATPAGDSTFGAPTPPSIVWTADATFGDDKYNYYKLLPAERHAAGELTESISSDTYNQADAVRPPPPAPSHPAPPHPAAHPPTPPLHAAPLRALLSSARLSYGGHGRVC